MGGVRNRIIPLLGLAAILALPRVTTLANAADRNADVPRAPAYYVFDEKSFLPDKAKHALESLLTEQDHTTGDQIVLAILAIPTAHPDVLAHELFLKWNQASRGSNAGVLITLFPGTRQAFIEWGVQQEPYFQAGRAEAFRDAVSKALRRAEVAQAAAFAIRQALEAMGSPLLANGKAQEIFASAGLKSEEEENDENNSSGAGLFAPALLLGFLFLALLFYIVTATEAHYTSEGWFRLKPWELLPRPKSMNARHVREWRGGSTDGSW